MIQIGKYNKSHAICFYPLWTILLCQEQKQAEGPKTKHQADIFRSLTVGLNCFLDLTQSQIESPIFVKILGIDIGSSKIALAPIMSALLSKYPFVHFLSYWHPSQPSQPFVPFSSYFPLSLSFIPSFLLSLIHPSLLRYFFFLLLATQCNHNSLSFHCIANYAHQRNGVLEFM